MTRTRHRPEGPVPVALRWLKPCVGVALLGLLFWLVPVSEVLGRLRTAAPAPLAAAACLSVAAMFASALKLWILLRVGGPRVSFGRTLRAYYVGAFFNNFLPTGVGGDVVKVNELSRAGAPLAEAGAATVVERASGVTAVMALGLGVSLGWGGLFVALGVPALRWPLAALCAAFLGAAALVYLCAWQRLGDYLEARRGQPVAGRLRPVFESFDAYSDRPGVLARAGALSVVFYLLMAANIVLVASALGGRTGLATAGGILPLVKIPEMLPISLGGLGVREATMTWCLAGVSLTPARAAGVALVLRLLTWLHSAVGGVLYTLGSRARRPVVAGPREEAAA